MAHHLSQEQVLDIRARLFSNQGRVTIASVKEALRVVGQDEISNSEILRLLGFDENILKKKQKNKSSDESQKKHKRRQSKKRKSSSSNHHRNLGVNYFVANASSSSSGEDEEEEEDDEDSEENDDNIFGSRTNKSASNTKRGSSTQHRIFTPGSKSSSPSRNKINESEDEEEDSSAVDENFVFPSTVDFPHFLQRLNRLLQDRETVKELRQLFLVLARFAFDRRQKEFGSNFPVPVARNLQQQQQQNASSAARNNTSTTTTTTNAQNTKQQQQQQSSTTTNLKQTADQLLQNLHHSVVTTDDSFLSPNSHQKDLERFLQIRTVVDNAHGVPAVKSNTSNVNANSSSSSSSPQKNKEKSSSVFEKKNINSPSSSASQRNLKGPLIGTTTTSPQTGEEIFLATSPMVLTREELRLIMSEVLESTVRKSTGIDHVMAGLAENEHFITCERFVELILRGGPAEVSSLFLL